MNKMSILYYVVAVLLSSALLTACGEDKNTGQTVEQKTDNGVVQKSDQCPSTNSTLHCAP